MGLFQNNYALSTQVLPVNPEDVASAVKAVQFNMEGNMHQLDIIGRALEQIAHDAKDDNTNLPPNPILLDIYDNNLQAYKAYQLKWMLEHDHYLDEFATRFAYHLIEKLDSELNLDINKDVASDYLDGIIDNALCDWCEDEGFAGELFSYYPEWEESETWPFYKEELPMDDDNAKAFPFARIDLTDMRARHRAVMSSKKAAHTKKTNKKKSPFAATHNEIKTDNIPAPSTNVAEKRPSTKKDAPVKANVEQNLPMSPLPLQNEGITFKSEAVEQAVVEEQNTVLNVDDITPSETMPSEEPAHPAIDPRSVLNLEPTAETAQPDSSEDLALLNKLFADETIQHSLTDEDLKPTTQKKEAATHDVDEKAPEQKRTFTDMLKETFSIKPKAPVTPVVQPIKPLTKVENWHESEHAGISFNPYDDALEADIPSNAEHITEEVSNVSDTDILTLLAGNETMTAHMMAEKLNVSEDEVIEKLEDLVSYGDIISMNIPDSDKVYMRRAAVNKLLRNNEQ